MEKKIIALTDYNNKFGSKHFDKPYRSGMDKDLLEKLFSSYGYEIKFLQFSDILNPEIIDREAFYIYTSSQDHGLFYKNYIEDVVLYLEESGCTIIPGYIFLRANSNKVFMELLLANTGDERLQSLNTRVFGSFEELKLNKNLISYPAVLKSAEGASGKLVYKANNEKELEKIARKLSYSGNIRKDLWDYGRSIKHEGYTRNSRFRKKFIVQKMLASLENDWKVYYFMDKLYIFYRPVLKHRDFRASGGGYDNYLYDEEAPRPEGMFQFVDRAMEHFSVPHASLDIAWDGKDFHLLEIQFLYFGTAGIPYSRGYYTREKGTYRFVEEKHSIEEVYVSAITQHISRLSI